MRVKIQVNLITHHASVYIGGDMTVKLKKIDDKPRNSIDTVLEWKVVPESTAYKGF